MADTGFFPASRDLRIGAEAAFVLNSFSVQSEFIWASADGRFGLGNPSFPAFYVMASYILTGEHRNYRERVGAFGTVDPANKVLSGGWGAWELATRFSYLDLNSGMIRGGVLTDWTLGLNWYLNHHVKVMANYIAAHPRNLGWSHSFLLRLQLTF